MKSLNASALYMAVMVAAFSVTGCNTAPPYGYANNQSGRASYREMCDSMRAFVRASLDDKGLRRAWFLPFGSYGDGSIDIYAPMGAAPSDDASHSFYEHRVGQLTHYLIETKFATALMSCLTRSEGFMEIARQQTETETRGEVRDLRLNRKILIRAKDATTAILISDENWNGDIEANMTWACKDEQPVPSP